MEQPVTDSLAAKGIENLPKHRLIFISNRSEDGNLEVFTLDPQGNFTQLTDNPEFDCHWPRPSPDKSSILFYRQEKDPGARQDYTKFALWTMDANGENEKELLPVGSYGWTGQGVVDWSPDGSRLVMAGIEDGFWHMFLADTDGSNPVRISTRDGLYADPSWSPDGTKIVYTAIPEDQDVSLLDITFGNVGTYLEIFTSDPDGSNEVQHTFDGKRDHDPYFSPDGSEISYETQNGGVLSLDWDCHIVTEGSGEVRLLADACTVPRWVPGEDLLYFYGLKLELPLRGWHIQSAKSDGSERVRITDGLKYGDSEVDVF